MADPDEDDTLRQTVERQLSQDAAPAPEIRGDGVTVSNPEQIRKTLRRNDMPWHLPEDLVGDKAYRYQGVALHGGVAAALGGAAASDFRRYGRPSAGLIGPALANLGYVVGTIRAGRTAPRPDAASILKAVYGEGYESPAVPVLQKMLDDGDDAGFRFVAGIDREGRPIQRESLRKMTPEEHASAAGDLRRWADAADDPSVAAWYRHTADLNDKEARAAKAGPKHVAEPTPERRAALLPLVTPKGHSKPELGVPGAVKAAFETIKEFMEHGYTPGGEDEQGVRNAAKVGLMAITAGKKK